MKYFVAGRACSAVDIQNQVKHFVAGRACRQKCLADILLQVKWKIMGRRLYQNSKKKGYLCSTCVYIKYCSTYNKYCSGYINSALDI